MPSAKEDLKKTSKLPKCPTGIKGLDEITFGGLPKSRPTLICGGPGCGKTMLAMEFICRGAMLYNEPGVFMAFEEKEKDLIENFASIGFDLKGLIKEKKLLIDYVYIERSEFAETGEYDLEGLFVRLNAAIDSIKAKRVVLDTIEALFSGLSNESILRAELRRLFRWLKDKGVTAIITGEKGELFLTKYGLEEYVADCVIFLDHKIDSQIATRRLKIIKYRGSNHGTNEFPFLIGEKGISVFPITSLMLNNSVSRKVVSTGIGTLDQMFEKKGYFKGSTILISGSAGSGKTTMGMAFADSMCRNNQRALYLTFEESQDQLTRDMLSVGIDLRKWLEKGLLKISANRSTFWGLEMHLVMAHKEIDEFNPEIVIIDPVTNLTQAGIREEARAMVARLIDYLKNKGITVILIDLNSVKRSEGTEIDISSISDTWMNLSMENNGHKRDRRILIIKSRGMGHASEARDVVISGQGIEIRKINEGGR